MGKDNFFIQRINDTYARLAEWVLDHRLIVTALCLLLCTGLVISTLQLRTDFSPRSWVPKNDPAAEYYMEFMDEFGNDEFVYILYKTKQGIFNLNSLRKTKRLTEDLKTIPFVKNVNSIINADIMEGDENGDINGYKLMDKFPESQDEANRLKAKLLDKPIFVNTYISKDGEYAAIFCDIADMLESDSSYHRTIGAHLDKILAKPEYKDFEFYPAGNPLISATFYDLTEENVVIFGIPSFILITTLLILLFRQIKGVVGPYVVVMLSILLAIGFMGIADLPITSVFSMIPSIMMAIGLAVSVHIISEYQIHLTNGNGNREAIVKSVRLLGFPCLFTSITTSIGFASQTTSSLGGIRDFGLTIAFSTLGAFAIAFTVLLLVLSIGGEKTERKYKKKHVIRNHKYIDWLLNWTANLNIRHNKKVLLIAAMSCFVLIYGATKIEINSSWLVHFGEKIKLYRDNEIIDKTMGGTGNFEVLLKSKKADDTKSLKFIHTLEKIQGYADSQAYLVKNTISIIDLIKDINLAINNNDKSFHRVPPSDNVELQDVNEFVYELAAGEQLEKLVSADLSSARLSVFMKLAGSKVYKQFHNDLVKHIESIIPPEYTYEITGLTLITMRSFDKTTNTMIKSLTMTIILISLMMIFVFRSVKIGLLSMIPNIFPVLFALGFMGLYGIWLSNTTTMIGCIIIGLAVDDTIHFISRYRMEFDRLGNYEEALTAAMNGVGRALTITTIILVIGFGVFMFSRLAMFFHSGILSSLCLAVALLADFFVAPSLILTFKPFGSEFSPVKEDLGGRI